VDVIKGVAYNIIMGKEGRLIRMKEMLTRKNEKKIHTAFNLQHTSYEE
jgi:hypothetical protein